MAEAQAEAGMSSTDRPGNRVSTSNVSPSAPASQGYFRSHEAIW